MADVSQFMKNLEFLRKEFGVSIEDFCNSTRGDSKKRVIDIALNSYHNYLRGNTTPSCKIKIEILDKVNAAVAAHPILKTRFPKGIMMIEMDNSDLAALSRETGDSLNIYTDKFIGNYMCYYMSTNIDNNKATHSGVLQLCQGEHEHELIAYGIFSLQSVEESETIYNSLGDKILPEIYPNDKNKIFKGIAYLSPTLLWCNLSNEQKTEHVSFSFDLSLKVTTKNHEKKFYGTRGIALSQTSGHSNQTATFPFVIMKSALTVSPNELTKYLHFNYSQIEPEEIAKLAEKATNFLHNSEKTYPEKLDEELIKDLLVSFIKHEVKDLLSRHVFNSHYYLTDEMTDFYKTIVRPMRQRDKNTSAE